MNRKRVILQPRYADEKMNTKMSNKIFGMIAFLMSMTLFYYGFTGEVFVLKGGRYSPTGFEPFEGIFVGILLLGISYKYFTKRK